MTAATSATLSHSASARVESLLARMTIEEKIGQMTQLTIGALAADSSRQRADRIALEPAKLREALVGRHVGSLINVLHGALPVAGWHALVREIQDVALAETRLGVPVLYGIDFVHGANYTCDGTIFPHNLGLAAAFDPTLVRAAAEVTAREARASGLPWNFAPVLDVGRQPLWPRFAETFGEDPLVVSRLGTAAIEGMQASGHVAATMKHFVAYGAPRSGRDRTPTGVTEREVREHHLPPFRAAVRAGALAVMLSSGDIDGEPLHASRYWLTDVLRGELGFRGVVVTDWEDVAFLHTRHRVASTMRDAVRLAVEAGIDVSMTPHDYAFADHLVALVRDRIVPEWRVDASVRRVLALKEHLGLFDRPYPGDTSGTDVGTDVGTAAARALAVRAARDAVVLLRNDGTLPLRRDARVLVTGPAADSLGALAGGWTGTWQGDDPACHTAGVRTLLGALRARDADVSHASGTAAAVRAAAVADVVVIALGEEPYAEWVGDIGDLALDGDQRALAAAIQATGTPTVLVLLEGRPRVLGAIAEAARAVVLASWPGFAGADAVVDVLFGDANPSGRLPFTYPRHSNALLTYDHRHTETLDVALVRGAGGFNPQWAFGHGLSYTTFAYDDLRLDRTVLGRTDTLHVQLTVTNTGARAGRESILLFTRQHFAAISPAVRRLRDFTKLDLAPGESATALFAVPAADLTYVGRDGCPVLDPGDFDVMVGALSTTFRVER